MNGISRPSFERMDVGTQNAVLYDYAENTYALLESLSKKIDCMDKKVERRKKFDTTVSAGAGFFGGAVVMLFKGLFGK